MNASNTSLTVSGLRIIAYFVFGCAGCIPVAGEPKDVTSFRAARTLFNREVVAFGNDGVEIRFYERPIDDSEVAALRTINTRLHVVVAATHPLDPPVIRPEQLRTILDLRNLHSLSMYHVPLTHDDVKVISKIDSLRFATLVECGIDDNDAAVLSSNRMLISIGCQSAKLTDYGRELLNRTVPDR